MPEPTATQEPARKLQGRCRCGRVRQRQKSEDGETYGYLCGGCAKPTSGCNCLPLDAKAVKISPESAKVVRAAVGKLVRKPKKVAPRAEKATSGKSDNSIRVAVHRPEAYG